MSTSLVSKTTWSCLQSCKNPPSKSRGRTLHRRDQRRQSRMRTAFRKLGKEKDQDFELVRVTISYYYISVGGQSLDCVSGVRC